MVAAVPLKKSPYRKEWMTRADPPKEASAFKNEWPVATPHFK